MDHPRARVALPDGQTLEAQVIQREKANGGQWWYLLEIPLYSRHQPQDGPERPEPSPEQFWAVYPAVQPIPGQDYSVLDRPVWIALPAPAGRVVIHGTDCWRTAEHDPADRVTDEQVLDLFEHNRAELCSGCSARKIR